jgi:hypothetical protein
MKKIIVCVLFFCKTMAFADGYAPDYPFPLEFYGGDYSDYSSGEYIVKNGYVILSHDYMEIKNELYSDVPERYPIKWSTEDKIDYITFYYNGKNLGPKINRGEKKYLVLFSLFRVPNDYGERDYYYEGYFLLLYDENGLVFEYMTSQYTGLGLYIPIKTSSELVEGNITYKVENLKDFSILLPWVEGSKGNGIGETIEYFDRYGNDLLVISNGYVDYSRPYLYGYNNRVKKIKVYSNPGYRDDYKIIDIEDKPGFQIFPSSYFLPSKYDYYRGVSLIIEILEIYPGTRYNDTCINYMQFHTGK